MFGRRRIKNIKSIEESKAFCIKPWVHLFVSQEGTVAPCCLTPWDKKQALGDVNEQPIQEIWNGPEIRSFRKQLLADKPNSKCSQCYQNEKVGLRSKRNIVNFLYGKNYLHWVKETTRNGYSKNSKPIYWDIRISNLCNLKCRICGHHSSSSWYDDAKAIDATSYDTKIHRGPKDFDQLMDQLDVFIDDLEELYFAGGEPIIMPEHFKLLNELVKRKKFNVKLRYNTNFSQTHFKNTDLLEIWSKFDDVFIHASIDDSGDRGMLQRKGLSWNNVIENRKRMLKISPNIDFMITPTISILNIFHICEFHKNWVLEGLIEIDEFIPHVLKNPLYYNLRILPAALKEKVKDIINNHVDWILKYIENHPPKPPKKEHLEKWKDQLDMLHINKITGHVKLDMLINELKNCIIYMNTRDETHLIPEFTKMSDQLDRLRNENTKEAIPELSILWD